MLTLILLVLLGGGLGLLAVSMAERQPATDRREHRRGADDAPVPPTATPEEPAESESDPVVAALLDPSIGPAPSGSTATTSAGQPRLVRRPQGVPKSQTAIEGAFGDVALASTSRRILSLAGIAGLVLAVAVMVTVVIAATVGAAVELFDQTFR